MAKVSSRVFATDEIDAAKRQFGQTKDLAHGPRTRKGNLRIDTPAEVRYYHHGGILPYVLRQLLGAK